MKTYEYKISHGDGSYVLFFKSTSRRKADAIAESFRKRGGFVEFKSAYPVNKFERIVDPQDMGAERLL